MARLRMIKVTDKLVFKSDVIKKECLVLVVERKKAKR